MRILMKFRMDETFIPLDYHKMIISFIKKSISEYSDGKFFDEFYSEDISQNKRKNFSWSVRLISPEFHKNRIEVLDKSFDLTFVIADKMNMLILFNSFLSQKGKKFKISRDNSIRLEKISILEEKVVEGNVAQFILYSPLVLRDHNKDNNKDRYITVEDSDFIEALKINLSRSYPSFEDEIKDLKIDISKMKKQVVPLFGHMIEVSLGSFLVMANSKLLNVMLSNSIGSRKSAGFGVLSLSDSWEIRL
ncbi:MAG: CRISPR-associated endoribonuclease Cas6 [Peptostreptococcus sp.]|uniref:CRISPR-associated endoribonuclease Cas6 n=1 Tax=Peptostreptococcus sp. TaxID=1262 RepID=UPI002FC84B35